MAWHPVPTAIDEVVPATGRRHVQRRRLPERRSNPPFHRNVSTLDSLDSCLLVEVRPHGLVSHRILQGCEADPLVLALSSRTKICEFLLASSVFDAQ